MFIACVTSIGVILIYSQKHIFKVLVGELHSTVWHKLIKGFFAILQLLLQW